uniref:NADH-ubiquinone oxidoreductase chain 4 n=1 Tax=Corallianassa coutierei TaxID=1267413 RepID=L0E7B5_CORCW|nr:NADH dehydrogenase subunit 4 [Corallianassa coutierei]AGA56162.1 NADH dehydrogenase subunit 4 [Corallianassa coutierei]
MLKILMALTLLIPLSANWMFVLNSLTLLGFLWLLKAQHHFFLFNLSTMLGTDFISYIMILLSIWITILMIHASQKIHENNLFPSYFILSNMFLCTSLLLTFSSMDLLLLYISFESSLIPTLVLIIGWGYQPERIQAGFYMLFYTLFASLPLLVSLLSLYSLEGSLTLGLLPKVLNMSHLSLLWYASSIFAFLVKLPMYFFHLWLPKAHVEAPVAGSMALAGVLLKLGGYGLIRILPIFLKVNKSLLWVWISVGIIGGTVVSILCLRQVDMKSLIAYSSVAHMGLVLCGFILNNSWGISGGLTIMVGHGLCSSGLFCIANMVYIRTASRSLLINKGLMSFMPSLGLWWFLLSIGNMAAPPTINLLGEINLLTSVISSSKMSIVGLAALSFFSASYSIYLFSMSQHGLFFNSSFACYSGKTQEFLTLFLHWLPLNTIILKSSMITTVGSL